jgi:hypothetical protein
LLAGLKAQANMSDDEIALVADQQRELHVLKLQHLRQTAEFKLKKIVEAKATHLEQHRQLVETRQKNEPTETVAVEGTTEEPSPR